VEAVTDPLVEFLKARLAEDKRDAIRTPGGPWTVDEGAILSGALVVVEGCALEHIARHDPDRVLREVEAKQRIVELHGRSHECSTYDHNGEVENCAWVLSPEECSTLRLLASVYEDHHEYRSEWKP
jgi:hypothetical protein